MGKRRAILGRHSIKSQRIKKYRAECGANTVNNLNLKDLLLDDQDDMDYDSFPETSVHPAPISTNGDSHSGNYCRGGNSASIIDLLDTMFQEISRYYLFL